MNATAETFLGLYAQLRETNGTQIAQVCRTLEHLYTLTPAVQPLFAIVGKYELDSIFREYAIFGLCTWFRNVHENMGDDCVALVKSHTLSALVSEPDLQTRKALVSLVTSILEELHGEWNELIEAICSRRVAMDAALPILSVLVYRLDTEEIKKNIGFFIECVFAGFDSDNIFVVSESVKFLVLMIGALKSDEYFKECEKRLMEILFRVAASGDSKQFLSVASPIICAYDVVNLAVLPFQPLFDFFLRLVQTGSFEPEYTLQLHSFLCSTVMFHKTAEIPASVVNVLFETEMKVGSMVLELDDVDPTMNWLCDVDVMLHALFYRTPLDNVVALVKETVSKLNAVDSDQARCMVIVLLDNGMECASDAFIPSMCQMFEFVKAALQNEGSMSQRLAAKMLSNRSSDFANEINANLPEICDIITTFMRNVDANTGAELFATILDEVVSVGVVFAGLVKTAFEMIQYPCCQVQYFGYITLAKILPRAIDVITEDEFDRLLTAMVGLLGLKTPNSTAFQVMAQLCMIHPERFVSACPVVIDAAIQGLRSADPYTVADVLRFVNKAIQTEHVQEVVLKQVETLVPELLTVAEREYSEEDSSASSYALATAARVSVIVDATEIRDAISRQVLSFIKNHLYIGAFKVFKILKGDFAEPVSRVVIEAALARLEVQDDNPFTQAAAVDALCAAVSNNRSLYGNEQKFIQTMIAIVGQQINPHTHEFQSDETIEAKIAQVLPEAVMKMNVLVSDTFNFLMTMIRSNTVKSVFAFDTLVVFFQNYSQQIPEDVQAALLALILPVIETGQPRVAQAAAVFLPYAYKASFFKTHGRDILHALMTRLSKEPTPSPLTDNLINAATELGGQVLGDSFPFRDVLQVVLPLLPVSREFRVCNSVYSFLASTAKLGKTDAQMLESIMRVIINVIAVPFGSLWKLERHVLNSFRAVLKGFLDSLPNAQEFIVTSLGNDSVKIENFQNSYRILLE